MTLPKFYRNIGERAIATYNFTDIAEGTGVTQFKGFQTNSSTGLDYHLSGASLISSTVETTSGTITFPDTQVAQLALDLDFDLSTFNLPKTIKGTVNIGTSGGATRVGGGGDGFHGFMIYKLRRIPATGGEIELGSVQSEDIIIAGAGSDRKQISVAISITQTSFKKGDILRLTVEAWGHARLTSESQGTLTIPHDPANKDGTVITPAATYTTKLNANVPFLLDL